MTTSQLTSDRRTALVRLCREALLPSPYKCTQHDGAVVATMALSMDLSSPDERMAARQAPLRQYLGVVHLRLFRRIDWEQVAHMSPHRRPHDHRGFSIFHVSSRHPGR